MWLKSSSKQKLIYCALGMYVALVLWVTLFSRKITYSHVILMPFFSYIKMFQGDRTALLENFENIMMFIPLGYILQMFLNTKWQKVIKTGFCCSLAIELIQFISTLGCFEVEDLFHNSIGVLLGYLIHRWVTYKITFDKKSFCKITLRTMGVVVVSLVLVNSVSEAIITTVHFNEMKKYAELNDRPNSSNYLVFTEEFGTIGETNVIASFNKDGSCMLHGTADEDDWKVVAVINLEKGKYIFKDLNNCRNVRMLIEKKLPFSKKYSVICELGQCFELKRRTKITVIIGVDKGNEYKNISVMPVIYKEE